MSEIIAEESKAVNAQFTTGLSPEDIEQYLETVNKMMANANGTVKTL